MSQAWYKPVHESYYTQFFFIGFGWDLVGARVISRAKGCKSQDDCGNMMLPLGCGALAMGEVPGCFRDRNCKMELYGWFGTANFSSFLLLNVSLNQPINDLLRNGTPWWERNPERLNQWDHNPGETLPFCQLE